MSTIALSHKAAKLMKLCDLEGFDILDDLLQAAATDSVCPDQPFRLRLRRQPRVRCHWGRCHRRYHQRLSRGRFEIIEHREIEGRGRPSIRHTVARHAVIMHRCANFEAGFR
jgi:hypothetical protein